MTTPEELGFEAVPIGGIFASAPHVLAKTGGRILRRHKPCGELVDDTHTARSHHAKACARQLRADARRIDAARRREATSRLRLVTRLRRETRA